MNVSLNIRCDRASGLNLRARKVSFQPSAVTFHGSALTSGAAAETFYASALTAKREAEYCRPLRRT